MTALDDAGVIVRQAIAQSAANVSVDATQLDQLRQSGRFEQFALEAARQRALAPSDGRVQMLAVEALLASGKPAEAELAAANLAAAVGRSAQPPGEAALAALRLWTVARFRQGRPLEGNALLGQQHDHRASPLATLRFWHDKLASRAPCRVISPAGATLPLVRRTVRVDETPHEVDGIAASIEGSQLPLVFVDTGAQYTLITARAARQAGVAVGPVATQLAGFSVSSARAALLRRLRLGNLELADVPVLVGEWPPLEMAGGQMALGTDLLHHLRMTIDYPAGEVLVEPARATQPDDTAWQVPLWTFSQASLCEGQLADGRRARVLIDTGNRMGAYLSPRWSKDAATDVVPKSGAPRQPGPHEHETRLIGLNLGGRRLPDWPVQDRMPADLERLNLVDILLGQDFLRQYRVTIDLANRRLELAVSNAGRRRDEASR